jgi:glutathione S-transferase
MPVNPDADIEITAFAWVPPFAQGVVRDLRVRWALEETGLPYRERLLDAMNERPEDYFREQPFGQVPIYNEGDIHMFETGAIVLHIGERSEELMPRDPAGRARATTWVIAALNSIEPMIMELVSIDIFNAKADWARARRPEAEKNVRKRLGRLSNWLGERDYLEDRFTAGDLMMTTLLRILRHTDLVAEYPNLAAYQARCEARPAFQRALEAQLAPFREHGPGEAV